MRRKEIAVWGTLILLLVVMNYKQTFNLKPIQSSRKKAVDRGNDLTAGDSKIRHRRHVGERAEDADDTLEEEYHQKKSKHQQSKKKKSQLWEYRPLPFDVEASSPKTSIWSFNKRCPVIANLFEASSLSPGVQRWRMSVVWHFAFPSFSGGSSPRSSGHHAAAVDFDTMQSYVALYAAVGPASLGNQATVIDLLNATSDSMVPALKWVQNKMVSTCGSSSSERYAYTSDHGLLDTGRFSTLTIGTIDGATELAEDVVQGKISVSVYLIVVDSKGKHQWEPLQEKMRKWITVLAVTGDEGLMVFQNPNTKISPPTLIVSPDSLGDEGAGGEGRKHDQHHHQQDEKKDQADADDVGQDHTVKPVHNRVGGDNQGGEGDDENEAPRGKAAENDPGGAGGGGGGGGRRGREIRSPWQNGRALWNPPEETRGTVDPKETDLEVEMSKLQADLRRSNRYGDFAAAKRVRAAIKQLELQMQDLKLEGQPTHRQFARPLHHHRVNHDPENTGSDGDPHEHALPGKQEEGNDERVLGAWHKKKTYHPIQMRKAKEFEGNEEHDDMGKGKDLGPVMNRVKQASLAKKYGAAYRGVQEHQARKDIENRDAQRAADKGDDDEDVGARGHARAGAHRAEVEVHPQLQREAQHHNHNVGGARYRNHQDNAAGAGENQPYLAGGEDDGEKPYQQGQQAKPALGEGIPPRYRQQQRHARIGGDDGGDQVEAHQHHQGGRDAGDQPAERGVRHERRHVHGADEEGRDFAAQRPKNARVVYRPKEYRPKEPGGGYNDDEQEAPTNRVRPRGRDEGDRDPRYQRKRYAEAMREMQMLEDHPLVHVTSGHHMASDKACLAAFADACDSAGEGVPCEVSRCCEAYQPLETDSSSSSLLLLHDKLFRLSTRKTSQKKKAESSSLLPGRGTLPLVAAFVESQAGAVLVAGCYASLVLAVAAGVTTRSSSSDSTIHYFVGHPQGNDLSHCHLENDIRRLLRGVGEEDEEATTNDQLIKKFSFPESTADAAATLDFGNEVHTIVSTSMYLNRPGMRQISTSPLAEKNTHNHNNRRLVIVLGESVEPWAQAAKPGSSDLTLLASLDQGVGLSVYSVGGTTRGEDADDERGNTNL